MKNAFLLAFAALAACTAMAVDPVAPSTPPAAGAEPVGAFVEFFGAT